ncbi:MAG: hypothetical protein ACI93N_001185 [Flavobacteriaceae bacterium]|jgi:hypothetical protein
MKIIIILISFLVFQNSLMFSQEAWDLNRDTKGIKVFSKEIEGYNFKSFKAITTINGSVHDFVFLLTDIANFPKWGHQIKSAKILERAGDTLQIYYSIAKVPFPYKDRDGIYLNRFKWNLDAKTLMVEIEVLTDYLDKDEKYIRVKGYGYWKIVVVSENSMEVTFSMQLDPGGSIPSWLANMFVDGVPYHTLLNLKNTIESSKGNNLKFDFID